MPNLLATKNGRLAALFFLYVTEGIPLGFTATALATDMRRMGLGPKDIGAFVASLYLPWAWKWAIGPVVDVVAPDRFGRRRAWIVGAQALMAGTLLCGMGFDRPRGQPCLRFLSLYPFLSLRGADAALE
ncbi:MAG: hypothetical protein FJ100_22365 [Deltaproteobacteria bacterium]|nr:hypothetical protein [Deltaproteobacteria bacterium]